MLSEGVEVLTPTGLSISMGVEAMLGDGSGRLQSALKVEDARCSRRMIFTLRSWRPMRRERSIEHRFSGEDAESDGKLATWVNVPDVLVSSN